MFLDQSLLFVSLFSLLEQLESGYWVFVWHRLYQKCFKFFFHYPTLDSRFVFIHLWHDIIKTSWSGNPTSSLSAWLIWTSNESSPITYEKGKKMVSQFYRQDQKQFKGEVKGKWKLLKSKILPFWTDSLETCLTNFHRFVFSAKWFAH